MTLDRRKVLIYLRPDISASERFADAKIEAHHRGDRGDMSRTALLAGLALGEVDSRLPSMLAALLAEDTKPETLRKMLASFLEIQPASPAPAAAPAAAPAKAPVSESVSARNLAGSLPD
ncbi:TPA: plasmid stabilization protein [Klebsiella pneumoniae]|uniref:plasmid partitioning/stability family protein n=1 Tax=Klebsiella pneumoniae TaxID=573 RepID=UPI001330F10C|nr:plasmid partitioning/stability family protein [Klebsiella pneumoniae]EKZ9837707.1 plasmid stabilization protein [Klebsiella pneumoniae]HBU3473577.1 plasmid stabilization protein [Klebsiella pneumoniae]HBX8332233.1 plasmid stabilization protein [Klebsiella pneumoniae]HBZ7334023.1 plasmid stabilization protein [Klebsiella pneumoniae]HCI6336887.1 plasmid stabilization protein [Klebsiella pneumoniae]